MIELICIRHGRTAWNADLRFQGHTDVPLDAHGRGQALLLAASLRRTELSGAVSSDLVRCSETARIVLDEHPGVPLRLDADLREMAFGAWEGLTWAQIVKTDPKLALEGWSHPNSYAPPGGERFRDAIERASRAVERIREETPDPGRVLVVTHAGILHALLRVVLGEAEAERIAIRFTPGGITRFSLEGGAGRLITLNEPAAARSLER